MLTVMTAQEACAGYHGAGQLASDHGDGTFGLDRGRVALIAGPSASTWP